MGKVYDIAIIGGGPAGLTGAMYAGRAGLDTLQRFLLQDPTRPGVRREG